MQYMENRYIETHQTWNKIAQSYEDMELHHDTYKKFYDSLSRTDASILEIGCSPGNIAQYLLELNTNFQILATDISANMIKLTKKNNPGIDLKILDYRHIDTIKNKYDGIVCGFTIPYLSKVDCQKLISNSSKLLKDNGILYLSFAEGDYKKSVYISGSSGDRTYFYYHDIKTIKQELKLNQMEIVDFIEKKYMKSDKTSEKQTIINAKKNHHTENLNAIKTGIYSER